MKTAFIKALAKALSKNSTKILTGMAITGTVATLYFGTKAGIKASKLIEEKKKELNVDKLPVKTTIRVVGKTYIPTTIALLTTVACMVGATAIGDRKMAAALAAANISDIAFKEYRDAVKEKEPKLHEEVLENIDKTKFLDKTYKDEDIIRTIHGDTLCLDAFSGRPFTSDREYIRAGLNDFNAQLIHDMSLSLNDFYDMIDLPHNEVGDILGWNIRQGTVELHFTSMINNSGKPVLVMSFYDAPHANFSNEW